MRGNTNRPSISGSLLTGDKPSSKSQSVYTDTHTHTHTHVCVCVCVRARKQINQGKETEVNQGKHLDAPMQALGC